MVYEVRIENAKKLLDSIIKKIKPRKKIDELIPKFSQEARKEIMSKYSCKREDIFGVFGKDDHFKSVGVEETGKKIIQRISSIITKNMKKVVVTGTTIYYIRRGKVSKEKLLINKIERIAKDPGRIDDREEWATIFCKILGHIPNSAVFLIDNIRSASDHEQGSFIQDMRDFGLAVVVSKKRINKPLFCKGNNLIQIKTNNFSYFKCSRDADFNKCTKVGKKGSKCLLFKLGLNKTTYEPFIRKDNFYLIIIDDIKNIDRIVYNTISENYSK